MTKTQQLQDCVDYQTKILEDVSRTFALTIPQLPDPLRTSVGNAYLLCRLADTIEDEPAIESDLKTNLGERLVAVIHGEDDSTAFAKELGRHLSPSSTPAEHDLVANTERVIRITHSLPPTRRHAIERCVRIMTQGMMEFQRNASRKGLSDLREMDRYCYVVAGVVGEMLTELFCDHCQEMQTHRDRLLSLAVSFGQALQMTNILKDTWEDMRRGACWLPRDRFLKSGVDLASMEVGNSGQKMAAGIHELIGIAHFHVEKALQYVQLIPTSEVGIRRHCLWALGMAVLTLRRIDTTPNYTSGNEVKISRRDVKSIILAVNFTARSDFLTRTLFSSLKRKLPLTPPSHNEVSLSTS